MKAIQTTSIGGPEVLESRTVADPLPNVVRSLFWFISRALLHRRVLRKWPLQGSIAVNSWSRGIRIHCSLGEDVLGFEMSDPVARFGPLSSYAQRAIVPAADRIVRVPDGVNMEAAAALMMQERRRIA
jgi:NADPH:quinone reductase